MNLFNNLIYQSKFPKIVRDMPRELIFLFVFKKEKISRKSPPFFHLWHIPVAQGIVRRMLRVTAAACPVTS